MSAYQSEALPVRQTQREEREVFKERKETRGSPVNKVDRVEGGRLPKRRVTDCKSSCPRHRSPRSRDKEIVTIDVTPGVDGWSRPPQILELRDRGVVVGVVV